MGSSASRFFVILIAALTSSAFGGIKVVMNGVGGGSNSCAGNSCGAGLPPGVSLTRGSRVLGNSDLLSGLLRTMGAFVGEDVGSVAEKLLGGVAEPSPRSVTRQEVEAEELPTKWVPAGFRDGRDLYSAYGSGYVPVPAASLRYVPVGPASAYYKTTYAVPGSSSSSYSSLAPASCCRPGFNTSCCP